VRIKLMPDYDCSPLWWDNEPGKIGNIPPDELGLSEELAGDLWTWAGAFDATLNRDDPPKSGFSSVEAERGFYERGSQLAERVADELGAKAAVRYIP
jgi:hypothetical protein